MIRYYWYITIDPRKKDDYSDLSAFIKRSITPPPDGLFYILETIDGYKHMVKERGTNKVGLQYTDFGKRAEIHAIADRIERRLIEQWRKDHYLAREIRERELEVKSTLEAYPTSKPEDVMEYITRYGGYEGSSPFPFGSSYGSSSYGMMARKRQTTKSKLNRKNCKCKPPIRKAVKKIKRRQ